METVPWELVAGVEDFVLLSAYVDGRRFRAWRIIRHGRDGIAVVDRIYETSAAMIREYALELIQRASPAARTFRKALEVFPGFKSLWRGILAQAIQDPRNVSQASE